MERSRRLARVPDRREKKRDGGSAVNRIPHLLHPLYCHSTRGLPFSHSGKHPDCMPAVGQAQRLLPQHSLGAADDVTGLARGIAYQVVEALGVLERSKVAEDVKSLDQPARAILRKHGVRFGAFHIYVPALLKPGPRSLAASPSPSSRRARPTGSRWTAWT